MSEDIRVTERASEEPRSGSQQRVGMRLWRVTVERTLMVMAADERHAEQEAQYYLREDDGEPDMIAARAVSDVGEIPPEWRNGIPWGGDRNDDRACRERVEPHTVRSEALETAKETRL